MHICIYICFLLVIPPLAVYSVCFGIAFRSSGFDALLSVVRSYYRFHIFQHLLHVLFAFSGNVV